MKRSLLHVLVTLAVLVKGAESLNVRKEAECGKSPLLKNDAYSGRIIGGTRVQSCAVIPWQVAVKSGGVFCGGSIITDRHILTAAHCVELMRTRLDLVEVIAGEYDLNTQDGQEQIRSVVGYAMHPNFTMTTEEANVGIFILDEPLDFDKPCVAPICLDPDFEFEGQMCTVSGWGRINRKGQGEKTPFLHKVEVNTILGKHCTSEFGIPVRDAENTICTGRKGEHKDACKEDAGGPLVCWNSKTNSFVQVGVTKTAITCALINYPGLYMNVGHFHSWIQGIIKEP